MAQERANLRKGEVDYKNTHKKYERTKYLFKQGAISALELDDAKTEMNLKEAGYRSIGERLKMKETGPAFQELKFL